MKQELNNSPNNHPPSKPFKPIQTNSNKLKPFQTIRTKSNKIKQFEQISNERKT